MYAARGSHDGERVMIDRKVRRRLRDAEVLAMRDVLIVERVARGEYQADIARLLRIDQSLVSRRLSLLPSSLRDSIVTLSIRYPDGIPDEARDRIVRAIVEHRDRTSKRAARHANDRH